MNLIRGCSAINNGLIKVYKNPTGNYLYACEILCGPISGHKNNMVCTYDIVDGVKTEVLYCVLESGNSCVQISRFKNPTDMEPYWKRQFELNQVPSKYDKYIREVTWAFNLEFRRS